MKLGIITSPNPEGIRRVKSLGLDAAEFDINIGCDVEGFNASRGDIKKALEETGVVMGAIGRWGADRISKDGINEEELETELSLIDSACFLGCPVYITGCNYIDGLSLYSNCTLAIEYLSRLIAFGTEKGVKICVYNCDWNSFLNCDPAWSIVLGHLPELGIKYDPSHAFAGGRNFLSEAEKWGNRFYHVHLKGSLYANGKHIDDPPAGLDGTDWPSFMAMLYFKGYNGVLSIEPHSVTWQNDLGEKGIHYTIDYFRKMIF